MYICNEEGSRMQMGVNKNVHLPLWLLLMSRHALLQGLDGYHTVPVQ